LLIVGGAISRGTSHTWSVCGRYWISSNCSVRRTTAPGVIAMLRPTWKDAESTICGTRGAEARSRTRLNPPRSRLSPAVSMTAFADAGFTTGMLLGDIASTTLSTRKRTRCSSRPHRPASATSRPAVSPVAR
jgi:hypothetical protein